MNSNMNEEITTASPLENALQKINNGFYLMERSWFMNDSELQNNVIQLVDNDSADRINVVHPDFRKHINELKIDYLKNVLQKINNGLYLMERSWFMNDSELQNNVIQLVDNDSADRINVVHPDFRKHINELKIDYL